MFGGDIMTGENNPNGQEENRPKSAGSKSGGAFSGLSESLQSGDKRSGHNRSPKNNAKAGSAAMQAMGIPKPVANMAANRLANRRGKQENVPEALKKRNNGMPNTKANSNSGEKGQDNTTSQNATTGGLASGLAGAVGESNQKANGEEKGAAQKTAEKAVEKGGSAAMQAAGVPKPVADMIAKKASGPALKIAIIGGIVSFLMWLIIIVMIFYVMFLPTFKGLEMIGEIKESVTGFFSSAGHWISGDGWCVDDAECAFKAEKKFYEKVDSLNKKYPSIDMSLVLASVLYDVSNKDGLYDTGNSNYCSEKYTNEDDIIKCESETKDENTTDDYQEAKDNLSKVAKKLSKGKTVFDEYMVDKFIPNNYDHIMKSDNKSADQILKEIYELSSFFTDYRNLNNSSSGGICKYSIKGQEVSELKVRLLTCKSDGQSGNAIAGEELVDLEKYILGVVYQENGGAPTEALKVQAIAARSFALNRNMDLSGQYNVGVTNENGQWILNIRNCTDDQVYCDPDKGCWSDYSGGEKSATIHSGEDTSKPWHRGPLASDSPVREAVKSVVGKIAVDSGGNIVQMPYTSARQNTWNDLAKQGSDYTEIIMKSYDNIHSITSNCSVDPAGYWSTWSQKDPRWGSIKLGDSSCTIYNAGCLVTSIAIQIAHSGTQINLPPGVSEFNPGVFVSNNPSMFSGCIYLGNSPWTNSMAPNFVPVSKVYDICGNKSEKARKVSEYINQGYYLVTRVDYVGQHWVAIIGTNGDELIMVDPATNATEVFARYGSKGAINKCLTTYLYKKND